MEPHERPTIGLIVTPEAGGSPTPPEDGFTPLTAEEGNAFEYLRQALDGAVGHVRPALMRVRHHDVDRAVVVAVAEQGEEVVVTPLALLLDDALFAELSPGREGEGIESVGAAQHEGHDLADFEDRPQDEENPHG